MVRGFCGVNGFAQIFDLSGFVIVRQSQSVLLQKSAEIRLLRKSRVPIKICANLFNLRNPCTIKIRVPFLCKMSISSEGTSAIVLTRLCQHPSELR